MEGSPEVAPNPWVTSTGAADEAVGPSTDNEVGVYFGLDDIARQIWRLIVEGATEDDIYGDMPDEPVPLPADQEEFRDQLEEERFTREVDS